MNPPGGDLDESEPGAVSKQPNPSNPANPTAVATVLDPVRFFSPLVAVISFALAGPALYRAFVAQTEPVAPALTRLLVAWVVVWGALSVLHLLIGPVSPRQQPDDTQSS